MGSGLGNVLYKLLKKVGLRLRMFRTLCLGFRCIAHPMDMEESHGKPLRLGIFRTLCSGFRCIASPINMEESHGKPRGDWAYTQLRGTHHPSTRLIKGTIFKERFLGRIGRQGVAFRPGKGTGFDENLLGTHPNSRFKSEI